EKEARSLKIRYDEARRRLDQAEKLRERLRKRRDAFVRLQAFDSYEALDWRAVVLKVEQLIKERDALTAASDKLRVLRGELESLEAAIQETEKALREAEGERGVRRERRDQALAQLDEANVLLEATPKEIKERYFPLLEALLPEALGDVKLTVE